MAEALEGIVVLDLTQYLAGLYGCALLGDVGADIVKIEPPGGDMTRQYPSTLAEDNRTFLGANRNKRSIVLDLKNPDGLAAFYRLVEKADVVVHNFRPSVPRRLGIDYETLKRRRPDLIYCSLTGYGEAENGRLRDHPGYDTMLQCFTGLAAMQGGEGAPQILNGSIIDYYSSTMAAIAILSALVHRLRTGEGQHVRTSLMRSAITLQAGQFVWADSEPRDVERWWGASYSGIYPTKEGYLYLQATTPAFWKSLCEFLGFPQLLEDPRFDTLAKRAVLREEIKPLIREGLKKHTAREWEELMLGKVPCIAVRSIGEMFDHPQVLAEGLVVKHEHPKVGKYRAMTKAVQMGIGDKPTRRAPLMGEHTDEILAGFGFQEDEVAALSGERSGGMKTQVFGDIRVDRISEFDFDTAPDYLLAGVTKDEAAEHLHWLGPRHMEAGTLDLKMSMHAYLIRTRHHTILFDTCCGNDKERSYEPTWHRLQNPFLERLADAGVRSEQVDFVMCSHLHADHIGWNTRLLNGEWAPTFPNARYLISKGEFEWWRDAIGAETVKPYPKLAWDDSVLPVVDHGLATFVEDDYAFENEMPDEVRYVPLHGHTKHHCGLYLCSHA